MHLKVIAEKLPKNCTEAIHFRRTIQARLKVYNYRKKTTKQFILFLTLHDLLWIT